MSQFINMENLHNRFSNILELMQIKRGLKSMKTQQTITKDLVEGLPVKEVSKSFQNQDVSSIYTSEDLMGLSWVFFEWDD